MNTKRQGNITEVKCMLSFMEIGYNVLTPYGDCERYDFVVDVNNKFYRIQVKTAKVEKDNSKLSFSTSSSNRKAGKCIALTYTEDEIDYFATIYNEKCYLVPIQEVTAKRVLSLRILPTANGQIKGVKWLKDYKLEEVIKTM